MRILVSGICPLPFENTARSFAPGVRTWQFAKPLVDAGHDVRIVARRIPASYMESRPRLHTFEAEGVQVATQEWTAGDNLELLRGVVREFAPEGIVGATVHGSWDACRLNPETPIWADQFGHAMAEAQAKALVANDNRHLSRFWEMVRSVLTRGDVFSAVSNPQRFATIGELGALGRLTRETAGYELVHTIPCGLDPSPLEHDEIVLRGIHVPEDAFVVLWSGSFNVWMDVDTLFTGLEAAMMRCPRIYFVGTGGGVEGHDEVTFDRFRQMVAKSEHRDRYVLRGWLPKHEVGNYYFEADVGISVDRPLYEGLLGSKNRILDWMRAGLPALAGELAEITQLVREEGIGFTFRLRDPEDLAARLLELEADRGVLREAGQRAKEYGTRHLGYAATVAPLLRWAENPVHAPDFGRAVEFSPLADLEAAQAAVPLSPSSRLYRYLKPTLERLGFTRLRLRLKGRS
jgi:glycosyltransferase involved in cell wall biosynthesis